MNDPYAILGVPSDADRQAIQAAYRRLARRHHPDFGGDPQLMTALNEAWAVLGQRERRAAYDRTHPRASRPFETRPTGSAVRPIAEAAERNRLANGAADTQAGPYGGTLDFGRYAGCSLSELAARDPDYLEWLVRAPIGRSLRPQIEAALSTRRAAAAAATATVCRPTRSRFGRRG
jgi:curved DNA-binding protein CbpA